MEISLLTKIALIGAAALFYWAVFIKLNSNLKDNDSRAAKFKVGGSRLDVKERMRSKETREDRRKRGEVSLRDHGVWKRRLR